MRASVLKMKLLVGGLGGLAVCAWSAVATAQNCIGRECITWSSTDWGGIFDSSDPGNGQVGQVSVDGNHVRPVNHDSAGAQRGQRAVGNLSVNPPPITGFSAVPPDTSNKGADIGMSKAPSPDATSGGRATTVSIDPTIPPCAQGPNPTCSFAGNLPVPTATGPAVHPNLNDNAKTVPSSDPVDPANGEFVTHYTDLRLPGFGVPFAHVRTYRSRVDYDGPLGFGWDHSYNQRIIPPDDANQCSQGLLFAAGDGTVIRFEVTPVGYQAPDGVHVALQKTSDGWILTRPDGIVSEFKDTEGMGLLSSIHDLNGQGLSFTWTKTDPGPLWRLTSATDSVGRSISYQYHPDGHLKSVSSGDLSATYDYDGQDLHHVVRADAGEETYAYRSGFPDDDRGDAVPIGQVAAACQKACSASPGCGAPDPCVTVAATARASCHAQCPACNAACVAQCPGIARDACAPGTTQCEAGCEAADCTDAKVQQICQDAYNGRNASGGGESPAAFCNGCVDAARASCGHYCSVLSQCDQIALGAGVSCGISAGITSGGTAAAEASALCFATSLIGCMLKNNIDFSLDTALRIVEINAGGADVLTGAVVDTGECIGTGVADGFCHVVDWFSSGTCSVDANCSYSRTSHAASIFCEDDCYLCNAFGENCGDGSCNIARSCKDDCHDAFFGIKSPGSCPEYVAGGGCPGKVMSQCQGQCRAACSQNCLAQSTAACEDGCQRACAFGTGQPNCDAACDAVDLIGECRSGCVDSCIASNSTPSGALRYGGLRELNHNLTKIIDGSGREVMVNGYGEDPTDPSFDSVVTQTNGDGNLTFRYRDIGAEQRGQRQPPTDPDLAQLTSPSMAVPALCSSFCFSSGGTSTCLPGDPEPFRQLKAERAMLVLDPYGNPQAFYADALGEIVARQDLNDNHALWMFNYRGGQLTAVQGPLGDHRCISYDPDGNVTEIDQLPIPGAMSDSDPTQPAAPRVFRWRYQSSPSRLTGVVDPRRLDGAALLQQFRWDSKGNLTLAVDGNGNATQFQPTAFGPPDNATLPDGSVTQFVYDSSSGVLESMVRDSQGAAPLATTVTPDALGRPSTATGVLGETTSWQWNGPKLTSITRHANGLADEITNVTVDNNGRLTGSDDGQLAVTTTYDKLGYVRSTTGVAKDGSAPTRVACSNYGPDGRLLDQVEPRGNRLHYTYDGAGRLISVIKGFFPSTGTWDTACAQLTGGETFEIWSGAYGPDGTLDSFVDAQGATTTVLRKTGFGEPAAILEANRRLTQRGYDELGHVIWEAVYACGFDASCAVLPQPGKPQFGDTNLAAMTEFVYDNAGALTAIDAWHFDAHGQPIGDGHAITRTVRDLANDVISITDDDGNTTGYRSDRVGRAREIDLPTGDVIRTDYADGGATVYRSWPAPTGFTAERIRLTPWGAPAERALLEGQDAISSRPARPVQTWSYDAHRRGTGGTDVGGASVAVTNDAFGQPAAITKSFGGGVSEQITQTFNPNGQLETMLSQAGFDTPDTQVAIGHDLLDRTTSMTRAGIDGALESSGYIYELGSDLVQTYTDARGNRTVFNRWPGGLIRDATATPPASFPTWSRTFTYDGAGRMLAGRSFNTPLTTDETVSFGWDSLGNKVSEQNSRLGAAGAVTDVIDGAARRVSTSYGNAGFLGGGVTMDRIHDPIGRLTDLTARAGGARVHFDYIGSGRSSRKDDDGAITTAYGFDAFGRLSSTTVTSAPSPLSPQPQTIAAWTWKIPLDGVPREASLAGTSGLVQSSLYQVDAAGRLVAEANGVAGDAIPALPPSLSTADANAMVDQAINLAPHRRLDLDGRGNWRDRLSTDSSSSVFPTRNSVDRYTTFGGPTIQYVGDALSEVDGVTSAQYQYDAFGQLISAGSPFGASTYTYDALGRMTSRSVGGAPAELFSYDGAERIARQIPTTPLATGGLFYTIDGDATDEHLLQIANGRFEHVHQDRLGSVYMVTSETGAVLERYAYTAYGERTVTDANGLSASDSTIGNDLGFQGQRHDANSGLIDMRKRWYKPDWGRFISADPAGYLGGSNFYAFVDSAPTRYLDPFGLSKQPPNYVDGMNHFRSDDSERSFGRGLMDGLRDLLSAIPPGAFHPPYAPLTNAESQAQQSWLRARQRPDDDRMLSAKALDVAQGITGRHLLDAATDRISRNPTDLYSWGRGSVETTVGTVQLLSVPVTAAAGVTGAAPGVVLLRGGGPINAVEAAGGATILPGGTGMSFAGHGMELPLLGVTGIPPGTSVTVFCGEGITIPDAMGQLIEQGDFDALLANPDFVRVMETGATTYLPGSTAPNLLLSPGVEPALTMFQNSIRVETGTVLEDLLKPDMGQMCWAACRQSLP